MSLTYEHLDAQQFVEKMVRNSILDQYARRRRIAMLKVVPKKLNDPDEPHKIRAEATVRFLGDRWPHKVVKHLVLNQARYEALWAQPEGQ